MNTETRGTCCLDAANSPPILRGQPENLTVRAKGTAPCRLVLRDGLDNRDILLEAQQGEETPGERRDEICKGKNAHL